MNDELEEDVFSKDAGNHSIHSCYWEKTANGTIGKRVADDIPYDKSRNL